MDSHRYRPEISAAFNESYGHAIRYSNTLAVDMLYVAVTVPGTDSILGVLRLAMPMSQIEATVSRLRRVMMLATIASIVLASVLALLVSSRITRPIRHVTEAAERLTVGDFSARIWPSSRDETARLSFAFNEMANRIENQIRSLTTTQDRLTAVLDHMSGGVIIVDGLSRVVLINPAAANLLDTSREEALGRSLPQVVRHYQIVELEELCQRTRQEQSRTLDISQSQQFLQVIATPLRGIEPPGVLIILRDLTEVRRLERVRQDFVSNVSHELRTPLASLKAILETLRESAIDDPPAAQRFLSLAEDEVDALTQMVQELLELSRIESGKVPLEIQMVSIGEIMIVPVERLRPQATRAGLELTYQLPEKDPAVQADPSRIHQVFTNLIHNAIKFTPPGGQITISAKERETDVLFAVQDTGVGISPTDLPRIFERFYKTDRSRSGGGTGLGLAISKHLIKAHHGAIWAKSTPSKGSTFFFTLPKAAPPLPEE
jgi:two-component system phosphate regulon sensor histidine kinase PhoR